MKHRHSIAIVVSFVLLLGFTAIAFWIIPDNDFSARENRALQTLPRFDKDKLFSGELSSAYNDYFADQFVARDVLVTLKGTLELLSGKGENNGILLGDRGQLAKRLFATARIGKDAAEDSDIIDSEHLKNAADGINRASENVDVPFVVFLTGRTADVASSAFLYPNHASDAMLETLRQNVAEDVNYLDLVPTYRERYESGEYVYYRTDHHWTTLGAYYAYCDILKAFGMENDIIPTEKFQKEIVSTNFYGTFAAASGFHFVPPDSVELWLFGNEEEFLVTADGHTLDGGFYNRRHLSGNDKYSVFLDGTHDVVTVTKKDGQDRPTLAIFKDSFANSVAPFLAQHFDLVLYNLSSPRTDYTDVTTWSRACRADAALVLYTLGNVIETDKMNRLR
ncbi:MAG: hypothetical protein E7584_01475 [Ruminococcaceae bacterium]|nr:hypothetical protein [Oscillospiraceae bacterium]